MSLCQSTPTATEFGTFTTDSLSTTFSESVVTVPASVTTVESTICPTLGVTVGCVTTDVVSTLTPEQVVTSSVPVVVTVPVVTTSATATLFSSICSDGSSSVSSGSTTSLLPPTTSLAVTSFTSTLSGGSVVVVSSTSTTVITPSTVVPVSDGHHKSSTNLGAIIGGAVGGVAGVALVLLLVWCILRRRYKNRDDDFDGLDGKAWPTPYPIKLRRQNHKPIALDEPNVSNQDPYYDTSAGQSSSQAGTSAVMAGVPPSVVRRRTGTSSEGFPNPWSGAATSDDGYGRTNSAPMPAGDASVFSGSVYSSEQPQYDARRPLTVANPHPDAALPFVPPTGDVKDRTIFLSADRGLQATEGPTPPAPSTVQSQDSSSLHMPMVFSEVSSSSGYGGSSEAAQSGSSSAPFVHQDAGRLAGSASDHQPQAATVHNPAKDSEAREVGGRSSQAEAPPAYEA